MTYAAMRKSMAAMGHSQKAINRKVKKAETGDVKK